VALERQSQSAAPAFERRRPAPAAVRPSAAPAPSTARSLQVRLGNQAAQSMARSLQSSKAATPPARVAKKNEPAEAAAEATAKIAGPVPAETEQETENKPATKGKGAEKAAPPSPRRAIAPAVKAVQERSSRARKRGNEKALVDSAQAAAKNPDIEGQRDAAVATVTTTVTTLDDAKKTMAKRRRDQFKADLTAALKAAAPDPKTKEEAEQVVQTGAKDASNALKSSLAKERDAAAGGMKDAHTTEVAPSPSGTQVNMESDAVGPKPAPVSAAPIVPAPLPPERFDYSSDRESTDTAMEESGVTTEQLGKGNEPQFNKTLSERSAAEKHEAAAEAKYRQSEAAVQAETKAEAHGELALQFAGIHGSRELHIGAVTGQQNATKTKDAQERERVTTTINNLKDQTRKDVGDILTKMEADAATIFQAGLDRAERAYERTFEEAKGGAWEWVSNWGDDWQEHIKDSLETAKIEYFRQVDLAIDDVATLVDARLEEAKARVAVGRLQVDEFVKTLHGKVKTFGAEAVKEISGDFDAMESEIDQRRDALIDNLTQQYKKSYERMSAKEEALREANKSFWERVYDATVGAIKKILAFKDMLVSILVKAASVVVDIISDPIGFLGNFGSAVKRGLQNFRDNLDTHLEKGLMEWLFGALGGAGLKMPEKFDLQGILSIVLQILGLTRENFRARAVALVGAPVVEMLEKSAKVFEIVRTQGVEGLWELIQEKLLNLKSMVMDAVLNYIKERVLIAGVTWIISLLNPASAFFKACKAIYDIVKFFIERGSQIKALIDAIIDSVAAIAKGQLDNATKWVENALAKAIPVAIGFLAALLSLGDISATIRKFIDRAQDPVNKAIDWVITMAAKGVAKLGQAVAQAGLPKDPVERMKLGMDAAETAVNRFAGKKVGKLVLTPLLGAIKVRYGFKSLDVFPSGTDWWIAGSMSPQVTRPTKVKVGDGAGAGKETTITRQTTTLGGDTVGVAMTVDWLGPNPAPGTKPESGAQANLMGLLVTDPSKRSTAKFIRGHLLNEHLGGLGNAENMFPITGNANSQHLHSTETRVKRWLKKTDRWIWYEVKVTNISSKLDAGPKSPDNYVESVFACQAKLKDGEGKLEEDFSTSIPSVYGGEKQKAVTTENLPRKTTK